MEETSENDATNKESEKPDTERGGSPSFHDFLEDDFLECLAVVDSWKEEDEETEPQENKEKVDSHSRRRPSRDRGDRKDRSSERNRTGQRRSRERDRGMNYRNDRYSHNRYSPRRNDRSPKDYNNRGTRNITERYQRKSPNDVKSKRNKTEEHKYGAKIEDKKPRVSSPHETLAKAEEKVEGKPSQDDGTMSILVPSPKLSSEQPISIDTCIKEITDVVPPGTEEEFVNLAKNVGGKPQVFPEPEWSKRDLSIGEHERVEKNGRKRSPIEYIKRPLDREYNHEDYMKQYGRSQSKEREHLRRNRSRSKEMHLSSITQRSRSRERQMQTIKRRSRSRERQMPIIQRSRSRERQMPIIQRSRSRERQMPIIQRSRSRERQMPIIQRSRSRERQMPIIQRSRSRERQMPIIHRSRSRERQMPFIQRSRSRERQLPIIQRSRSRERQMPIIKRRSRSRERQTPTIKRRSRSRERQMPAVKRRSRSRERQIPTIKRRSRSRERQIPTMKRRSQSREKLSESQKRNIQRKRQKLALKKTKASWSPEKKAKGISGRQSPSHRPYASKTKDSYKVLDPELSPVSGTSLSSPSLSLSPVSSEGERWRRRNSERRSPFSLSPARSYISLSSEHSDRSPKRKRSPFWREIQRTFAAQDMAKSHFAKVPPLTQQSYYESKPPAAQPVSYPAELYPNVVPNYPPPAVNYYQPPPMQPPPPGDFMVSQPIVPAATAPTTMIAPATVPMMVPPVSAPMMVPPVSAPMMVPPVSAPMMVPPVTQMAPIAYPLPPCPVPPPVQPVAPLQAEVPNLAAWPQQISEHGGTPKWEPEHGGTPNWEPEKPVATPKWEPEKNDGAKKWEPEKHGPPPKWEPETRDPPKWEPQKRGNVPKWKPGRQSGTRKRKSKRSDDEELIPPPPPTISQPEKSLSSLLEASAKAGVTQKKQSSVEHNVVNRCEEALRTLSADRGLVLSSSGSFVFHRDEQTQDPLLQESTNRFQSPLLRNPTPVLNFTEPPSSNPSLHAAEFKAKEDKEGKKPSMLSKAAAKLASKEMAVHPTGNEASSCLRCAERDSKKFVECSAQASVESRTVGIQCDNYFELEFGDKAPSVYRRYQPLPQPPKGILKSSRY